ncbi:MAG: DNA polymerase/3'-5' exonuclease PolX [Verrucomicrobiales bacterium]
MPDITRDDIIEILERIALLLDLKGENPFKVRAYRNGAEAIRTYSGDFIAVAADGDLKGIKGIGDALAKKVHQLVADGKMEYYENLRTEFPESIFELFEVQGLGPKKVKAVHDALGVNSIADLKRACEEGKVAELPGFGKKTAEKILEAIAFRESHADEHRQGDLAAPVEMVLGFLRDLPAVSRAEVGGSYRRGKEVSHDLDFLCATKEAQAVMDAFAGAPFTESVIAHGKTKTSIRIAGGVQCDLRAVSNAEFPFALAYFTGNKDHNVAIRGRARDKGYTLNEYRLAPLDDPEHAADLGIEDERGLYRFLGLDYIEPELRENTGEIEAAESGKLPQLVKLENLRGTFHNHTTASDGRATLAEMAAAAQDLGLQYLGIADHSKASFQANGLDEKRLRDQIAAIAELNAGFDGFRLFAGSEVDILRDGSLDFGDDLLAELDYAVASVHNVFTLSEADQTARIIKAIENPHVTMIGHLTGRLLLQREPYALNIEAVLDAAAETGTIIELNANPWRLDLDWRWWKLAKAKGVKCAINPDAHSTKGLQDLFFGTRIARKGWLEKDDVVNCLPLGKIEKVLAAKRDRKG